MPVPARVVEPLPALPGAPLPAPLSKAQPIGSTARPAVAPLLEQLPLLELDGAALGHHPSEALSEPSAAAYLCSRAAPAATLQSPPLLPLLRETVKGLCLGRHPTAPLPAAEVARRRPLPLLSLPDSALWLLLLLCRTCGTSRPLLRELCGRGPTGDNIGRRGTEGL